MLILWHKGIRSEVFFAASMPAIRASSITSPFGMVFSSILCMTSLFNLTNAWASAYLSVIFFSPTSIMSPSHAAHFHFRLALVFFIMQGLFAYHAGNELQQDFIGYVFLQQVPHRIAFFRKQAGINHAGRIDPYPVARGTKIVTEAADEPNGTDGAVHLVIPGRSVPDNITAFFQFAVCIDNDALYFLVRYGIAGVFLKPPVGRKVFNEPDDQRIPECQIDKIINFVVINTLHQDNIQFGRTQSRLHTRRYSVPYVMESVRSGYLFKPFRL